jgi:UDP-glucose 4-epimerase
MAMAGKLRIFISGISGYFAGGLLPLLEQDPKVEKVVGIDRQPLPKNNYKKVEFHQMDVRDPKSAELIRGCDVFIHLAFILLRRPGQADPDLINITGSRTLIDAAAAAGVKKIIFTSSAVGYGFHPDNPLPLTEENPLRPNIDLYYSKAKAVVEQHLDELEEQNPKIVITRLRPCTVVGPRAEKGRVASLIGSTGILVAGFNPPVQLLHEDDLAQAIALAVAKDLRGAYIVTSDGARTLTEFYALRGASVSQFALPVARFLMWLAWRFGGSLFAADWLDLSRYSIVASNRKLKAQGWTPRYTTEDTFYAVLKANGITVKK